MGLFSWFKKKPAVEPEAIYKCDKCGYKTPWLSHISYHYCEEEEYMFKFTNRDEYVAYRKDWKARYLAQIIEIKNAKEAFKQGHREFSILSKGERVWDCKVPKIREIYAVMELNISQREIHYLLMNSNNGSKTM